VQNGTRTRFPLPPRHRLALHFQNRLVNADQYVRLVNIGRLRPAAATGDVRSMRHVDAIVNLAAISIRIIDNMPSG
jgi:hypothetical protein